MNASSPYLAYLYALLALDRLIERGHEDTPPADRLMREMRQAWASLSPLDKIELLEIAPTEYADREGGG